MIDIFWPYIVGNDSPISNLFENINSFINKDKFRKTVFKTQRRDIFPGLNTREKYVHTSLPLVNRAEFATAALAKHDIIHTGGRASRHYWLTRLSRIRNPSIKHVHTFRVDVDPAAGFDTENRRKLANMADTVTAVSKHTAKTAKEAFDVEPTVIYNGVDSEKFNPSYEKSKLFNQLSDNTPTFLYVGSFSQRKRPGDVLEVAKAMPEVTFVMIGNGELFSEVKRSAKSIDNIHLAGYLEKRKLPAIYANSTGFIFPSVLEGCPNVVLEAMASETPVIGYEATSMPELVTDDKTGYLRSVGDIEGLINSANRILDDNSNMLGTNARKYILNNHTFDSVGREYEKKYNVTIDQM